MYTESLIFHVKTDNIYKDIADVETRFDTSNFEKDRPLLIGLMKDELSGQIMKEFVGLRA